jgi:hypothetical protein
MTQTKEERAIYFKDYYKNNPDKFISNKKLVSVKLSGIEVGGIDTKLFRRLQILMEELSEQQRLECLYNHLVMMKTRKI